jgi:peptide/nickel transport system substrate-binding protein
MQHHLRLVRAVGVAAVAVTVLGACGGGGKGSTKTSSTPTVQSTNASGSNQSVAPAFNAATIGWVNKSDKQSSGTLQLLTSGDCDSWDPANTYYGFCWNMQRLISRTLIGFSSTPGSNNVGKLEPDLATGMGEHSADLTQWTYHLKKGLKYEDGSPITSKDIKHAIERLFATDVINGGPTSYYVAVIKHPDSYKGVFKSGDLSTITTPDDNTITFQLSVPYSDFDYLMAMAASTPVPAAKDTAAKYTLHPVASGPFKIDSYQPAKQITFSRNPNFDQASDPIAHPLVAKIVLTVDSDPSDIDRRLQAGTADARADLGVEAAFQDKIAKDPNLKKYTDDPVDGSTRYFAVFQTVKPLDNVHCRRAIFYAMNKRALKSARGGTYAGDIGHTMANPTVAGYDPNANPYPSGPSDTGDLVKAKDELKQCGQPNGFTIKEANTGKGVAVPVFNASQVALARVGIKVVSAIGDSSTYYSRFIGSPQNVLSQGLGLGQAGWGADFPTGYGFWNSIANGKDILPTGNTNYTSLNDPVVNGILDSVVKTPGRHEDDFKKLDAQVMQDAVMLPYLHEKTLYYRNPRMTNVRSNFSVAFGIYDFVNVGLSS